MKNKEKVSKQRDEIAIRPEHSLVKLDHDLTLTDDDRIVETNIANRQIKLYSLPL